MIFTEMDKNDCANNDWNIYISSNIIILVNTYGNYGHNPFSIFIKTAKKKQICDFAEMCISTSFQGKKEISWYKLLPHVYQSNNVYLLLIW